MTSDEFRLASPTINRDGRLPRKYTDEGLGAQKNLSPPQEWYNVPDPSGPIVPWTCWVAANIPPTFKGLPEGFSGNVGDGEIQEGFNDHKVPGWRGPKLPSYGHRFELKLHALDRLWSQCDST